MAVNGQSGIRIGLNDYRGLSAYEIAVKNGFEGTETEWLASLKGEPGKNGDTITVNKKRAVDGNISVNGTDIQIRAGEATTVEQVLRELQSAQSGGLTAADIVNDLTTGGEAKVLSAEMGARLEHTKPDIFWAEIQIPIGNWQGDGPYTRDVALEGVLANSNTCAIKYSYATGHRDAFVSHEFEIIAQKDDALTVQVSSIPEEAFPVSVMVVILKAREESV